MVKRRGLGDMLRSETQRLEQTPEVTDSGITFSTDSQSLVDIERQTPELPDSQNLSKTESGISELPQSAHLVETDSVSYEVADSVELPKYQQLVRKEARLHEVQYDDLTRLARELNRKKRGVGEIITANTLLRVATELLLRRRSELRGDTEDELLASLQ